MSLSPIDVAQQQFRRSLSGFHPREVEAFLKTVADTMTGMVKKNTELQAELVAVKRQLQALEGRENDVKEALVLAQRAVDEVRGQADKEAQLRREQAEVQAQQIVADAQGRHVSLTAQVKDLVRQRTRFVEELRGLVTTHARLLELHGADAPALHAATQAEAGELSASGDVFEVLQPPPPPEVGGARRGARPLAGRRAATTSGRPA